MTPSPNPARILADASAVLAEGDARGAELVLAKLWNAGPPPPPPAVHLLGLIRRAQGRIGDAELLMRQSIEADPRNADYRHNLGLLLQGAGFADHAAEAFEGALKLNPDLALARLHLARAYAALGRHVDAEREARLLVQMQATAAAWTTLGGALRHQGRIAEALEAFDRALALDPRSVNARHDRAVALDKAGRGDEADRIFAALHAEGVTAPELARNWASALIDLGRAGDAEARLAEAAARHPTDAVLQETLAKVRWMRGDEAGFARDFKAAVAAHPRDALLRLGCFDLLRRADRHGEAEALLREGLDVLPDEPTLLSALGVLRGEQDDIAEAVRLLERGHAARPDDLYIRESLVNALLRAGRAGDALAHIRVGRAATPDNGVWLAHEAVALRMTGDPGYARLYDFDRAIRVYDLPAPPGYVSVETFNEALAATLRRLHTLNAHPLDQSLRLGTQTAKSLLEVDDPALKAFFAQVDAALADYIAALPDDPSHPVYGRKPASRRARLAGCWSVRLKPGGYHVNHVHLSGWISSAYYVAVPPGVAGAPDRQGWLQFAAPRWPTPGMTAERFVEPRVGRLALFPSCFWHGTVPFREGEERLTIAFDAVPDARLG
ncbi:MAG: tetratricopeptide repeat protein [Hyphomonadaceae bacterium]|nr:tetratricopeptide repeat protein [Hyphomonadaceae bacterium]